MAFVNKLVFLHPAFESENVKDQKSLRTTLQMEKLAAFPLAQTFRVCYPLAVFRPLFCSPEQEKAVSGSTLETTSLFHASTMLLVSMNSVYYIVLGYAHNRKCSAACQFESLVSQKPATQKFSSKNINLGVFL